ncbi:hypothetical protein PR202_ga16980 [Eleusine coracana subsp. coracana]|uniref:Uncharacterized protein n=1 Tax=Eleusine coracana subsp. coracana TaxID=191504 RepID=A0AAV5CP85_ELECO|nr:hypothetical protein PR202_ga16980 [Eleusine coracana subsp. coracana]
MASPSTVTPAPLLPVTNLAAGGGAALSLGSVLSDAPLATPDFYLFLSRLSNTGHTARRSLADWKLWTELLDRSAFSRAPGPTPSGGC